MFRATCPTCNSAQVRRSRRHPLERILLPFASACRCNECGRRFYTVARSIRQQTESHEAPSLRLEHRLRWVDPPSPR